MSAPVRIEAEAWTDLRFATLARILGLGDADHALIRTARIWSWQAEHYTPDAPTYVVDLDTIESALGTGGAAAMVRARLAEETPDGFRIRGARGRIEWLWQKRQAARAGGEATKRKHGNKQGPHGQPHGEPEARPTLSPLVIALDQIPECSLPRDPAVRAPDASPTPPPEPALPASRERAEARRRLIGRAWTLGGEAFARVQADGIDLTAPNGWAGLPSASSPPMANLLAILDELLAGDRPDFEAAEAKIANRIAVAEAEARAMSPPSARYMTPARIWNRESFSIAVDMSPEQAAAPRPFRRAGPRGSAERAPNRDVRVGQIQPHHPSEYNVPDGEMPL